MLEQLSKTRLKSLNNKQSKTEIYVLDQIGNMKLKSLKNIKI